MLFRLIRLPNLIIVAVTQGLIYYQLLHKTFRNYSLTGTFNSFEFVLFVIATILITASGYIINDIYDKEIDAKVDRTKNRPLANGSVSIFEALLFLCILLLF